MERPEDAKDGVKSKSAEGNESSTRSAHSLPDAFDSSSSLRSTKKRFRKKGSPTLGQPKTPEEGGSRKRKKSIGQRCRSFLRRLFRSRSGKRSPCSQSLTLHSTSPATADSQSSICRERGTNLSQSVRLNHKPPIDVAVASPNNSFQAKSRRSSDDVRPHSNSFSNRSRTPSVKSGSSPKAIINISPSLKVVAITPTEEGNRQLLTAKDVSNDCVVLSFTQTEVLPSEVADPKSVQSTISGGETLKISSLPSSSSSTSDQRRVPSPANSGAFKSPGYSVTVTPNNNSAYAFDYETSHRPERKIDANGNSSKGALGDTGLESKGIAVHSGPDLIGPNTRPSDLVSSYVTIQPSPALASEMFPAPMQRKNFSSSERNYSLQTTRNGRPLEQQAIVHEPTKYEESQEDLDLILDNAMKDLVGGNSNATLPAQSFRNYRDQPIISTRNGVEFEPKNIFRQTAKISQVSKSEDKNNNTTQQGYTFGDEGNPNANYAAFFSNDPLILYSRRGAQQSTSDDQGISPDSGVSSIRSPSLDTFSSLPNSSISSQPRITTHDFTGGSTFSDLGHRQHKYRDDDRSALPSVSVTSRDAIQPDKKLVNIVSPTAYSECQMTQPITMDSRRGNATILAGRRGNDDDAQSKESPHPFPRVPPPSYNSIIVQGDPVDLSRFQGRSNGSASFATDGKMSTGSGNVYDVIPASFGTGAQNGEGIYEQIPFHKDGHVGRMHVEPKVEHIEFSLKPILPRVPMSNQMNEIPNKPAREPGTFHFPTIIKAPVKDFRINEAVQQELRLRHKNASSIDDRYNKLKEEYLVGCSDKESQSYYKPHHPQTFSPIRIVRDAHDKDYFSEDEIRQKKRQLEKVMEMERQKKALRERLELQSRRHTDRHGEPFRPLATRGDDLMYDNIDPPRINKMTKYKGRARALYNFKAQKPRELSLRKGDVVHLLRKVDRNWFEGEHHGMAGIFPISYVEVLESIEEVQSIARMREGSATVLYDFHPRSPLELPLKKGYVITLIKRLDRNWYEGRCGNRQGMFPAAYVSTIREPDTPLPSPCATPIPTPSSSRIHTPLPGGQSIPGWQSPSASSIFSYNPDVPAAPRSPTMFSVDFSRESTPFGGSVVGAPSYYPNRPSSVMSEPVRTRDYRTLPHVGSAPVQQGHGTFFVDNRHPLRSPTMLENVYDNKDFSDCLSECGWMDRSDFALPNRRVHVQNPVTFGTLGHKLNTNDDARTARKKPAKLSFAPIPEKDAESEAIKPIIYPRYRALHDFSPRSPEELGLDKNEIVRVVEKCKDGWYIGFLESTRQFGLFPGNFVEPLR